MSTVAIHTLGCKVNAYESEAMLEILKNNGYIPTSFNEKADVYIINTCTVTNTGDSKSRQMIRKAIKKNPDAIICVVGCYAQIDSETIQNIEGVHVIIGTSNRNNIYKDIKKYQETKEMVIDIEDISKTKTFENLNILQFENKTRAFLKIQDGCNNFCTYCIIPYARGRMRSRLKEDVLKQAQILVDAGYKEIVLTGIHTAGYGEDLDNYSFYDLLVDLTHVKGLQRLRISSIEMSQITPEIIELIGHNDIIVDHLHIPIQSGCNKILKKMNRHYTTEEFESKLRQLKSLLLHISITTDVIVGFPGETDEDFKDTYDWIKKNQFHQLHVFPYSPRRGTPAANYPNQINGKIKKERVNQLLQLSDELTKDYCDTLIHTTQSVLFEEKKDDYYIGHASNYMTVKVKDDVKVGEIYPIYITQRDDTSLIGEYHEKN